jgi:hypothetical protein
LPFHSAYVNDCGWGGADLNRLMAKAAIGHQCGPGHPATSKVAYLPLPRRRLLPWSGELDPGSQALLPYAGGWHEPV